MNQLEGPWKNKTVVEIPLKNPRGVNAFAEACMAGLSSKPKYDGIINGFNQFNMYSAASMLQLPDLLFLSTVDNIQVLFHGLNLLLNN